MYENGLAGRERLPNYNDSDYIIKDGKKILNPDWEKARADKLNEKNNYFRCPVCNQGIAFGIYDWDCKNDIYKLLFINPRKNKDGAREFLRTSYQYFDDIILPSLLKNYDMGVILDVCKDRLFDIHAHKYFCYQCFKNNKDNMPDDKPCRELPRIFSWFTLPIRKNNNPAGDKAGKTDLKIYSARILIDKYKNPLSETCDYEDICDICGDQIYETVIPEIKDGKVLTHTV
jgi:hypothetical protein